MKHYILFNYYGSETDVGFQNSWSAMAFDSRADRNDYVQRHRDRDMSIRACSRSDALKYAERLDGEIFLRHYEPEMCGDVMPKHYFPSAL